MIFSGVASTGTTKIALGCPDGVEKGGAEEVIKKMVFEKRCFERMLDGFDENEWCYERFSGKFPKV